MRARDRFEDMGSGTDLFLALSPNRILRNDLTHHTGAKHIRRERLQHYGSLASTRKLDFIHHNLHHSAYVATSRNQAELTTHSYGMHTRDGEALVSGQEQVCCGVAEKSLQVIDCQ